MSAPNTLIRRKWPGALLRAMGHATWAAEQTGSGITLLGGRHQAPFTAWAGPARLSSTLGFTTVTIPLAGNHTARLAGVTVPEATRFIACANDAFHAYIREQCAAAEDELRALSDAVSRLDQPRRYPAACLLAPFLTRATAIIDRLPTAIPEGVLSGDQERLIATVRSFRDQPEEARRAAIARFIASELAAMNGFFENIEKNPLTPEQRLAVVTDEDATLILAGAGSGKTSVIVAKAAYLIERGIRRPEEILLLAFGRDAAAEMAARIKERAGVDVDALTFHALGNRIIRTVEDKGPALAAHASDDAKFRTLLRDILLDEVASTAGLGTLLMDWFSAFYWPYKTEWDFKTQDAYFRWVEAHELRTLNGDRVKSFEEWEIANWLYRQGIAHEYEPLYEGPLPPDARGPYRPDFRLTESGIYIEHFGVRKAREPDGSTRLTTAPHIDRARYLADMAWKRQLHATNGTTLIETFSYEKVEGTLLANLKAKLAPHVTLKPVAEDRLFAALAAMGQVDAFTQTLATFLRHFKSAGATIASCEARAANAQDVPRSRAFLKIFDALIDAYEARLGDMIDFEDMIVRATAHVQSGGYKSPYRHILVDEFQDISAGRAQLLRALQAQHEDARLFAVGDDWQSIYRFAGSDIHLMRDFGKEFGGRFAGTDAVHSIVDLGRTFRSVDKIAHAARRFVLRNPAQIKKTVKPAATTANPAITVAYYKRNEEGSALRAALERLDTRTAPNTSVLLLGRYHHAKPAALPTLIRAFPSLAIRFMTVHASKGLEADHVIILRAASDTMGFPSEIVDDPLLDLVLPDPENFEHAEERRLFYVALTRARDSVTILADQEKPSTFVRELVAHPEYETTETGAPDLAPRPCPSCGGRLLAQTAKAGGTYYACEHRHLCGQTLKPCSVCGTGLPVKSMGNPHSLVCRCGASFPACPSCTDGWLVERRGRTGRFLGCVNYPACKGTQNLPGREQNNTRSQRFSRRKS
ncbi:UvrD-helicase domain-containing protein [Mycoplana ramosa]|uniref:DNA 3'-5' helicase n=1 Tax=Mycoplana ramosa TaxID=40837 RepID=A0ABW3YY22_MYCRA